MKKTGKQNEKKTKSQKTRDIECGNFVNEVEVWIQTKVVEISVDKDVFEKRLERACLNDDGKMPPET